MKVTENEIDNFINAGIYFDFMPEKREDGNEGEGDLYNCFDASSEAREFARTELQTFLDKAGVLQIINETERELGTNNGDWCTCFWLERNGHGAGFMDLPELFRYPNELSQLARIFRELYTDLDNHDQIIIVPQ